MKHTFVGEISKLKEKNEKLIKKSEEQKQKIKDLELKLSECTEIIERRLSRLLIENQDNDTQKVISSTTLGLKNDPTSKTSKCTNQSSPTKNPSEKLDSQTQKSLN